MTIPAPDRPAGVWRFAEFVLDAQRYELRRDGESVHVEPQVFDVLIQLVSHHDRFVTKEELFDSVWGDGEGPPPVRARPLDDPRRL